MENDVWCRLPVTSVALWLTWWSPFLAAAFCYAVFYRRVRQAGIDENIVFSSFVRYVAPVAGVAVAVESAIAFAWLASMEDLSGNTPLVLIVYALPAFAIGEVVGCVLWMRKPLNPPRYTTVIRRFAKGGNSWDSEVELTGVTLQAAQSVLNIPDLDGLPSTWKIPEQALCELERALGTRFDSGTADYYLCPRELIASARSSRL